MDILQFIIRVGVLNGHMSIHPVCVLLDGGVKLFGHLTYSSLLTRRLSSLPCRFMLFLAYPSQCLSLSVLCLDSRRRNSME
jgi:hypothetical protein